MEETHSRSPSENSILKVVSAPVVSSALRDLSFGCRAQHIHKLISCYKDSRNHFSRHDAINRVNALCPRPEITNQEPHIGSFSISAFLYLCVLGALFFGTIV